MADPKIRYDIEAGIKGEADVKQLSAALRALGGTLEGDLKTQALGAASALEQLGAKQQAISDFTALKRATESLGAELDQTTASVDRLGAELPQAAAATAAFAEAESKARAAADGAKTDLDEQRAALVALRTEYTGGARQTDAYKEASDQLKVTIRDLATNLKEQRAAVGSASAATRDAQANERTLATEYERSVDASKKLSVELGNKSRALEASRSALSSYGLETSKLRGVEKELEKAIGDVRTSVGTLAPAFAAAAASSKASTDKQTSDQRTLREGIKSTHAELQRIQTIAAVAVGGGFVGGLLKDVAATADEFKNLQARIKLATGDGENFQAAMRGVTDVAIRTNTSLSDTATLFARLAKAGTEAGLGARAAQDQALAITATINQAVQLSGSSADASSAAVTQLIQGLQSGVLRGEEFNSVMEQAPRLAEALATGLGRTTGELRAMAEQGALTSTTVIKALTSQSATVEAEFAKLPATVGRALGNLSTQWSLYVGAADNGMASSANAAKVINAVAANLDTLVTVLYSAGKAWAAIKIAGLVGDMFRWVTATTASTVAVTANTTAVAANTIAHGANAAAAGASAAAATANAGKIAASTATVASAGSALGVFGRLLGPIGVAVVALGPQILDLARAAGEGVAKWTGAGKAIQDYEDRTRLLEEASKATAAAQRAMAAAAEEARAKQFDLSKQAVDVVAKFDDLVKKGDSAGDAIAKIGKDFDLGEVPGIKNAGAVLDRLVSDGKISAGQFQTAWAAALKGEDLATFEVRARAAFSGSSREAERMAAVLNATAREAIRRTGLDFDLISTGMGAASRSAINDVDAIVQSFDRLKKEGVDVGQALTASLGRAIDTADGQKAIAAVIAQIEALRGKLGQKITDGLLDQAAQKSRDLKAALEAATPGIQSIAEAMKQLGITSDAALKQTATQSKAAYDTMRESGLASARELSQGFQKAAAEAIEANKGIAPSWVANEAAVRGYKVVVDETGKQTIRSIDSTIDGLGNLADSWRNVGNAAATAAEAETQALERKNSEIERRNDANEKAAELERKRMNVDKDGFSTDKNGGRLVAGSDLQSLTGVTSFLQQAGIDNVAIAKQIALEFADAQGNITYMNNPGQRKYGGDTISVALLKAAERYTFGLNGGAASLPGGPAAQAAAQGAGSSHKVTIELNGATTTFNGATAQDAQIAAAIVRQLAEAKGRST